MKPLRIALTKGRLEKTTVELLEKIGRLNRLAGERGQTLAQMALAWVLRDSMVTSVIVGASSVEQLDSNLQSIMNTGFTDEEIELINSLTR